MNIVDIIILVFIVLSAFVGFSRGFFKQTIMFVGTILVICLSFIFKNPLSLFMYKNLPFFKFGGLTSLNILVTAVYELIRKSFKENYRLKNELLPNLIKNNKEKISGLQKEIDDMKKQTKFSKTNNLNIDEIDLSRINYSNGSKEKYSDLELSNIKVKNFDFNIN